MHSVDDMMIHMTAEDFMAACRLPLYEEKDSFIHDAALNWKVYRDSMKQSVYHDIHQNVFIPSSFRLLTYEL